MSWVVRNLLSIYLTNVNVTIIVGPGRVVDVVVRPGIPGGIDLVVVFSLLLEGQLKGMTLHHNFQMTLTVVFSSVIGPNGEW